MEPSPDGRLRALAASQDGLVTAAQALRVGLSYDAIRARRRRGEWRALARGVYLLDADMYLDGLADRVFWRAALLAHGPGVCLVATTAAAALGMVGLPRNMRDIEIAQVGGAARHKGETATVVPGWGGTERGIVVRQLSVDRSEVVIWNGLPVRDAFHTAVDAALVVDRPTALALLDSALHLELLQPADLMASVAQAGHRRGIVEVRKLAALADARAESQVESRVRLACIDGDVPPDDLQHAVFDENGRVVARGDLAWLAERRRPLLGEADGESVHSQPKQVYRDRWRGNALVTEACDTVRFTYADTFKRGYIPWVVKRALRAA